MGLSSNTEKKIIEEFSEEQSEAEGVHLKESVTNTGAHLTGDKRIIS